MWSRGQTKSMIHSPISIIASWMAEVTDDSDNEEMTNDSDNE